MKNIFRVSWVAALVIGMQLFLTFISMPAIASKQSLISTNPYSPSYGPPNCTWYAWQRAHDVDHIDLQFTDNAVKWISRAQATNMAWSEDTKTYVPVQVNTTPQAGDIVVFPYFDNRWAYTNLGHVAFVDSVDNLVHISQQSYRDYSPGQNTSPYSYVKHISFNLQQMEQSQNNQARFLHFDVPAQSSTPITHVHYSGITSSAKIAVGGSASLTLSLQNTGNTTWSSSQGYTLELGICWSDAPGQILCDDGQSFGSETGYHSIPLPQDVAPNQSVNFTLDTPLPSLNILSIDTFLNATNDVILGWWVKDADGPLQIDGDLPSSICSTAACTSVHVTGTVPPPFDEVDNSQLYSKTVDSAVPPATMLNVNFSFTNTGTSTWYGGYELVCDTYYHPTSWCNNAQPSPVSDPNGIEPGKQADFSVSVVAPSTAGTYTLWWDMADKGSIFGDNNAGITITVTSSILPQPTNPPSPPSPSPTNPPGPPPTQPTPTPTPTPIPAPQWHPWYSVHRPYCDDSGNWNGDVNHSTTHDCSSPNGLVVSQYGYSLAELDLDTPNGVSNYNQSQFYEQVDAVMLKPSDQNVFTALIVQTPEDPSLHGGYMFGLNSLGNIYIWQIQSDGSFSNHVVAYRPGVSFNPAGFRLKVQVQNGQITGFLDDQPILSASDSLSSGVVGLMTFASQPNSTATLFSNFVLGNWS